MSDTATLAPPDPRSALLVEYVPLESLTLTDTCDRCGPGISAFAQIRVNGSVLRFCGHCFTRNEATFIAAGYEIKDERGPDTKRCGCSTCRSRGGSD